jgi:hypothetical protein
MHSDRRLAGLTGAPAGRHRHPPWRAIRAAGTPSTAVLVQHVVTSPCTSGMPHSDRQRQSMRVLLCQRLRRAVRVPALPHRACLHACVPACMRACMLPHQLCCSSLPIDRSGDATSHWRSKKRPGEVTWGVKLQAPTLVSSVTVQVSCCAFERSAAILTCCLVCSSGQSLGTKVLRHRFRTRWNYPQIMGKRTRYVEHATWTSYMQRYDKHTGAKHAGAARRIVVHAKFVKCFTKVHPTPVSIAERQLAAAISCIHQRRPATGDGRALTLPGSFFTQRRRNSGHF